ncbi:LytR C-terminal domain-containing protein, partial [Pseudoduganella sp. RAF53_2]|uniref:LytR C-terminal domain-containing protein n=1 Tax=Pseudoduganella sp. RAF53_2 TaxID=3233060 RepID=UPI003F98942A
RKSEAEQPMIAANAPAAAPLASGIPSAPAALQPQAPVAESTEPAPEPYVQRAPKATMSITDPTQLASRMELVQLSPNVFELKQRVAVAASAAAGSATAPAAAIPLAKQEPKAAQAALAAMPKATKVQMARLEISNGNGVTGMAKRFRSMLGQIGIPVDRLSNDKPYRQVATTIQYSPGFEKQAESLQKALQGKAQLASRQLQASDVRIVLGKDAQQSLTAATEAAGLTLVVLNNDNN